MLLGVRRSRASSASSHTGNPPASVSRPSGMGWAASMIAVREVIRLSTQRQRHLTAVAKHHRELAALGFRGNNGGGHRGRRFGLLGR